MSSDDLAEPAVRIISRNHWAKIPETLIFDPDLSDKAVRVYAALYRYGITQDSCFPSYARIAERIGCSARTIPAVVRELEAKGWVKRVVRWRENGGRSTNGYDIADNPDDAAILAAENQATTDEQTKTPEQVAATSLALVDVDVTPENISKVLALSDEAPFDDFDVFWSLYPRKEDRKAAAAKHRAAAKAAAPEVILVGLERWVTYWAEDRTEKRFIPLGATWLNQERWTVDPYETRGKPGGRRGPQTTDDIVDAAETAADRFSGGLFI